MALLGSKSKSKNYLIFNTFGIEQIAYLQGIARDICFRNYSATLYKYPATYCRFWLFHGDFSHNVIKHCLF
jgi:hypothetical protein